MPPNNHLNWRILSLQFLLLALSVIVLYGSFLSSPLVFDDIPFFQNISSAPYQTIFSFDLRWLPYATLIWTYSLSGESLVWLRLENMALHIINV